MEKTFSLYVAHLIKKGAGLKIEELFYDSEWLNAIVLVDEPSDEGGKAEQRYTIKIQKEGL